MKFQPDTLDGVNQVTRLDASRVWVGSTPFTDSVLIPWLGEVLAWPPADFEALQAEHFERICALKPELVIFGSGPRIRFAAPALMRSLMERRIGVETMDTAAACRTYNVLVNEGRSVVAALLLPKQADKAP
jgi:uncharacterized protein